MATYRVKLGRYIDMVEDQGLFSWPDWVSKKVSISALEAPVSPVSSVSSGWWLRLRIFQARTVMA
jgi:hypothetical protein